MGIAHIYNRAIAEGIYEKELTDDEKEKIKQGKIKEVEDAHNEIWTPGVEQWVEALCGRK